MSDWFQQMNAVCDTARYFMNCNVMDIEFMDGSQLEVYVAISPEERNRGLSEVSSIDLDGMLFVYSRPSYTPFTMKKMMMDLDIAWYGVDGSIIQNGTYIMGQTEPIYSPQPYSYVLEVPAGTLPKASLKVRTN
jgi:uncharacterized membrane protein (UPF0127 family)